jgi:hypothetical protein
MKTLREISDHTAIFGQRLFSTESILSQQAIPQNCQERNFMRPTLLRKILFQLLPDASRFLLR